MFLILKCSTFINWRLKSLTTTSRQSMLKPSSILLSVFHILASVDVNVTDYSWKWSLPLSCLATPQLNGLVLLHLRFVLFMHYIYTTRCSLFRFVHFFHKQTNFSFSSRSALSFGTLHRSFVLNVAFLILVFSDAGRLIDQGHLSFFYGLHIGKMSEHSLFHTLSWTSHNSHHPVISIGAAETLTASETIDEAKILKYSMSTVLCSRLWLLIAIDSSDLYTFLSTLHTSVDKSIVAYINWIC